MYQHKLDGEEGGRQLGDLLGLTLAFAGSPGINSCEREGFQFNDGLRCNLSFSSSFFISPFEKFKLSVFHFLFHILFFDVLMKEVAWACIGTNESDVRRRGEFYPVEFHICFYLSFPCGLFLWPVSAKSEGSEGTCNGQSVAVFGGIFFWFMWRQQAHA